MIANQTGLAAAFRHMRFPPIQTYSEASPMTTEQRLAREVEAVTAALSRSATPCVMFEAQDGRRYLLTINGQGVAVTHASRAHALALAAWNVEQPKTHNALNFWFVGPVAARAALEAQP